MSEERGPRHCKGGEKCIAFDSEDLCGRPEEEAPRLIRAGEAHNIDLHSSKVGGGG